MGTEDFILVSVTASDIRKGIRCSDRECPIALALRRKTKKGWSVGPRGAATVTGFGRFIRLPKVAQVFIDRFDKKRGVKALKPFRFKAEMVKTW